MSERKLELSDICKYGYQAFGPDAMEECIKFFNGEIDFKTYGERASEKALEYRALKEAVENARIIKMTSEFYNNPSDTFKCLMSCYDEIDIEIDNNLDGNWKIISMEESK